MWWIDWTLVRLLATVTDENWTQFEHKDNFHLIQKLCIFSLRRRNFLVDYHNRLVACSGWSGIHNDHSLNFSVKWKIHNLFFISSLDDKKMFSLQADKREEWKKKKNKTYMRLGCYVLCCFTNEDESFCFATTSKRNSSLACQPLDTRQLFNFFVSTKKRIKNFLVKFGRRNVASQVKSSSRLLRKLRHERFLFFTFQVQQWRRYQGIRLWFIIIWSITRQAMQNVKTLQSPLQTPSLKRPTYSIDLTCVNDFPKLKLKFKF